MRVAALSRSASSPPIIAGAGTFAAYEEQATRYFFYLYYGLPFSAPLLADPRAKEMLTRCGFVAYWREKGWPSYCRPVGDDEFACGSAVRTE